ncbi:uncharacterized protein METZ01_LOCUS501208, partial [marine metagenome]
VKRGLLTTLASHPVAANLLMTIMLVSGVWALSKLNTQFFPNFDIDFVSVSVPWSGASAEDIETLIAVPLEQELRNVNRVKEILSKSVDGRAVITLEFEEGTDMGLAVDEVKEKVD